jgi:hypothetical protein
MRRHYRPLLFPAPEYPISSAKKSTQTPTNDEESERSAQDQWEMASGSTPENKFPAGTVDSKSLPGTDR